MTKICPLILLRDSSLLSNIHTKKAYSFLSKIPELMHEEINGVLPFSPENTVLIGLREIE